MGLLEILLGKPGTLHSPGKTSSVILDVPPDIRECSSLKRGLRTSVQTFKSIPSDLPGGLGSLMV